MMAVEDHPAPKLLSDYALGRLLEPQWDAIAEHVDNCSDCQDTLSHLQAPDDTLVRGLAGSPPEMPFADEPEFAAALSNIRRASAAQDPEATQNLPGVASPSVSGDGSLGTLRDYELLALLGQGGMGTVYRARHLRLDRLVAVKVLPAERMRQPQAIARFHREMKAVGNLDHPHIVRAFDAGEVDGKHFLAMELVDGLDLSALVEREGPLAVADACELVRQAAVGLDHAHQNGLIHRDIKPSNLMLDRRGMVKLLDLGLARLLIEPASADDLAPASEASLATASGGHFQTIGRELTGADQVMGTPDYMAPEQCTDSRAVDARSDVYSLGATLYRLLAGQAPYSGTRYDTLAKKISGLAKDPVPPIAEHRRNLPTSLVALLNRMLAKQPQDRPATPALVAEALTPFCSGHQIMRLASADAAGALAGTAGNGPPRRPRRFILALSAAGAFAALGVVLARIITPDGVLVIEVAPEIRDAVQVEVSKGNKVQVLSDDPQHGWSISLEEGTWDVRLKGQQEKFELDARSVEITRGKQQLVHVSLRRAEKAEADEEPSRVASTDGVPRGGTWQLNMPAGFQRAAPLISLGDNRFHLKIGGNLGGEYRWVGEQLVVEEPDDARYMGLAWQWEGDELVLIDEPADRPAGPSYLGARLRFISVETAEEAQARVVPDSAGAGPLRRHLGETDAERLTEIVVLNPANGHYYMRGRDPMSWHAAQRWCEDQGGHLASITSAEENQFIYKHFAREQVCWLGGTDREKEGSWKWDDGEPLEYQNWFRAEPSGADGEDYMAMGNGGHNWGGIHHRYDAFWNDLPSDGKQSGYLLTLPLCEWAPGRAPEEIVKRARAVEAPQERIVAKFDPEQDWPVADEGVTRYVKKGAAPTWKFTTDETRTFQLLEIKNPSVDDCILAYRASMMTEDVAGQAYLELRCRVPGSGESISKGFHHAVKGSTGWANYETPFFLQAGQRPDLIRLNLVIEGRGTALIREIEVLANPLPDAIKTPEADAGRVPLSPPRR